MAARVRRALISVSDKRGVVEFARGLAELGIEILSTGGTARALREAGVPVVPVEEFTGAPEILDGRVKTLHPAIHGGILARRDLPAHLEQIERHGIGLIDLVCVNLYPFEATVARPECTLDEAIENIDIGGPTMLRAAAKNHAAVTVVVDPADYDTVLEQLRAAGTVDAPTRARLARKVFQHTARYDGAIADYLGSLDEDGHRVPYGETLHLQLFKAQDLRYGENPHQSGALYGDFGRVARQLHGKELSYNNIVDIDAALWLMADFLDQPPTVAILKHNTPCGVGQADDMAEAYRRAYACDPESPFGGIVIANGTWTRALAEAVDEIFTEVLIAPDFAADALELLRRKKNRRVMVWDPVAMNATVRQLRGVAGGALVQQVDRAVEDPAAGRVVTRRSPSAEELRAMAFGIRVVKHVKSNAVVFVSADRTLAVGGGATSRVDALRSARAKAERVGIALAGSVLASDAFFPFPDGIEEAAAAGATAVIQPGGSVRDEEVIAAADRLGLAMVFTGIRHFRH